MLSSPSPLDKALLRILRESTSSTLTLVAKTSPALVTLPVGTARTSSLRHSSKPASGLIHSRLLCQDCFKRSGIRSHVVNRTRPVFPRLVMSRSGITLRRWSKRGSPVWFSNATTIAELGIFATTGTARRGHIVNTARSARTRAAAGMSTLFECARRCHCDSSRTVSSGYAFMMSLSRSEPASTSTSLGRALWPASSTDDKYLSRRLGTQVCAGLLFPDPKCQRTSEGRLLDQLQEGPGLQ